MSVSERLARLRRRRWVRWTLDGLLLCALLTALATWQARSLPTGPTPDFALPALGGERYENAQLVGRPTLLVFWAPWCGVCRLESQNLSWVQALVGERARVLSVAVQYDSLDEVEAYVAAHGVDYPVLLGGRTTARRFGVQAYPTAFFLDSDGAIKRAAVGYTTTAGLLWRLLL